MSLMKAGRPIQAALLMASVFALAACGFHLRRSAALPAAMEHVHVTVTGNNDLRRVLARSLEAAGATVEDDSGPGIAELRVPVAAFGTETLTLGGYALITEYAVRLHVQFDVTVDGKTLIPLQRIDMSREYSYTATDTIGNASEVQEIQGSLIDDMVQAIQFRLQAASKRAASAAVVSPATTPVPASSSSAH